MVLLKYYKVIINSVILLLFNNLTAQTVPSHQFILPNFENKILFNHKNGLSHSICNTLLKDKNDFLWIGTQDGINRYDGQQFKSYHYNKKDSTSIPGNFINSLFEDSEGQIWISTVDNGIAIYNPYRGTFKKIQGLKNEVGLSQNCIVEDNNQTIWISLGNAIYELSLSGQLYQQHKLKDLTNNLEIISCIQYDTTNYLIIGTKSGAVYSYTNDSLFHIVDLPGVSISHIIEKSGNLFIGTNKGLWKYQKSNGHLSQIPLEEHIQPFIYKIIIAHNSIFVATGNGLFIVSNNTIQHNFKKETLFDVIADSNYIWIASTKGLYQVSRSAPIFNDPLLENGTIKEIKGTVSTIHRSENGIWFGMRGEGLYYKEGNKIYNYNSSKNNCNLKFDHIRSITQDSNNYLWIGTIEGIAILNLNDYDPNYLEFVHLKIESSHKSIVNALCNNTRHVYCDKNNQIWITSFGGGLFRFVGDLKKNNFKFQHFAQIPGNTDCISSNQLHCIQASNDSTYWIASRNGLIQMSIKNNDFSIPIFSTTLHDDKDKNSIPSNVIYDIYIDALDKLWLGTTNGPCYYDPIIGRSTNYSTELGLTSMVVNSILKDQQETIWLSTNKGICKWNEVAKRFNCYTEDCGLITDINEIFCKWKDEDGLIYFGGNNGVNSFYPRSISSLNRKGSLIFTSIKIKNHELNSFQTNILSESIEFAKNIKINYQQVPLTLEFSDRDFRKHNNNKFYYKILPQDKEWNSLQQTKTIHLSSLESGRHILQVQGGNEIDKWDQSPLSLSIKVSPPWWRSIWAYLFYSIIVIIILYYIYTFQLNKTLAKNEALRLKELDQLKSQLYTNLTHEFRTPLTVINGMTEQIKTDIDTMSNNQILSSLKMITRNSSGLLKLVNQLLDLAKAEQKLPLLNLVQTDVIPILNYLAESYQANSKLKEIQLILYSEIVELWMDVDIDVFIPLVSNIISNAIKFTPEKGRILIHAAIDQPSNSSYLIIKIKDNGIGISKDDLPYIFDRFYQAKSNNHNTKIGTGIGLALSKELVEKLNGKIEVKSQVNQGTTFIINIPINTKAVRQKPSLDEVKIQDDNISNISSSNKSISTDRPLALIIEDNKDVAIVIGLCIDNFYDIIYAKDGDEGLEKSISTLPDIIISDVMMPKKDGYTLLKELKNDIRTNHIPIILLTARVTNPDRIKGLEHGADAYLTKPFKKPQLLAKMQQLIKQRDRLINRFGGTPISNLLSIQNGDIKIQFIQKATKLVLDNINDEEFGPAKFASLLHLSESQVYRKLKSLTDKSTAIFIRSIKLRVAHDLLLTSDKTVSEIAYQVGFNDLSYFSKVFKDEYGSTPGSIRKV